MVNTSSPRARPLLAFTLSAVLMASLGACSRGSGDPAADAAAAFAAGDYAAARVHVANALKDQPGDAALLMLQADIALALDDADTAVAALRQLVADGSGASDARDKLARAYLLQGNPKRALDMFVDAQPAGALGEAARVGALLAQGRIEDGLANLDAALTQYPDAPDLLLLDGDRQLALGNADRASAIAEQAVRLAGNDANVQLFAGRVAMSRGQLDRAEGFFNAALKLRANLAPALLALGSIAADKGDRKRAEGFFRQVDAAAPGNPVSAYYLAQFAFDAGQIDQAREILQAARADSGTMPAALALDGIIASRKELHEEAAQKLTRYFAQGGEDGRARLALAVSQLALGETALALATIRPLANAANANAAVLGLAAEVAERQGDPVASRFAARAAQARRADPIAKPMLEADAAIRAGNWAGANRIYTQLLNAGKRDNIILLNNAAAVRLELGDAASAVPLARQALALNPDDPMVMDTLAWALFKSEGQTDEAVRLITAAAAAQPGNADIRRHYAAIMSASR